MRTAVPVFVALVLVALAVGACAGGDVYKTDVYNTSTTAHTPPKLGDTLSAWGIEVKLSGPERYSFRSTTLSVGNDKEGWVAIAHIRNTGSKEFQYSLNCWEARDQYDRVYRATVSFPQLGFTEGTISPGGNAGGYIGFVLPDGSTLASVTFTPVTQGLKPESLTWEK